MPRNPPSRNSAQAAGLPGQHPGCASLYRLRRLSARTAAGFPGVRGAKDGGRLHPLPGCFVVNLHPLRTGRVGSRWGGSGGRVRATIRRRRPRGRGSPTAPAASCMTGAAGARHPLRGRSGRWPFKASGPGGVPATRPNPAAAFGFGGAGDKACHRVGGSGPATLAASCASTAASPTGASSRLPGQPVMAARPPPAHRQGTDQPPPRLRDPALRCMRGRAKMKTRLGLVLTG